MDVSRPKSTRSFLGTARNYLTPLLLTVSTGWSQSAKPLAFEAEDVHPSPSTLQFRGGYFHVAPLAGDRYVVHQATPLDLISLAYGVERGDVSGGPPGLEFDHYEVVAKVPPGTKQADAKMMLQALLADRFKLIITTETKPLPAFLLKIGKGALKLKPAADDTGNGGCRWASAPPAPNTPTPPTIMLTCSDLTMAQFVNQVRGMGNLDQPVVDMTELKGAWDFDFPYTLQPGRGPTVSEALDRLGLKLELGVAPRRVMTIVSMADTPTANVAGIEKILPPSVPTFEVASIRPSKQVDKNMTGRDSGNQITLTTTLIGFIGYAWGVSTTTVFDQPSWIDDQVWEVSAKVPAPAGAQEPKAPQMLDSDQVRLMMRSLLEERFGLKVHGEERSGNAFVLLAGTPKLKKADPANRSSCGFRPAPGEKNPHAANPLLTMYLRCQNVTMDQFASQLMISSPKAVKVPILNSTGISGRYDVTLSWTDDRTLETHPLTSTGGAPGESGGGASSDAAGVPISLPDVLLKQLGLKLLLRKRPVPALVIDHLDKEPTAN